MIDLTPIAKNIQKRMFEKSIRQWGYDAHAKHNDNITKIQSMHSLHANKDKS